MADAVEGDRAFLTGAHAQHLSRVLRAKVGQEFDIATADSVRRGKILHIDEERVEFTLGERVESEESLSLTLWLAVFKFDRMEWAIEKCTELGATDIVPVIARRTEAHLAGAAEKRVERWRRLAMQAAEQSRRARPPEIAAPVKLKNALTAPAADPDIDALRLVLAETEEEKTLAEIVGSSADAEVTLAIGPEGGWADDELKIFRDSGWVSASLGKTILRAETAAIAATAILMALRR
jgi:16S rRNA (uracil1498-N3)-methyltransferase